MSSRTIAVIGSGPAGLAAGFAAATAGSRVMILEQRPAPGAKLLASGGGKCNVTNTLDMEHFARAFGRQWRFMLPALQNFHGDTLLDFFAAHQVKLAAADSFHYFPESGSARDVLNMFLRLITGANGELCCNTHVKELLISDQQVHGVCCADGSKIAADAVIIATGGKSFPALGGNDSGYDLARCAGHTVTELFPAMTGIHTAETWVHECAGIALPDCIARIDLPAYRKQPQRGELLFTHHGFSAFAILDLAETVARLLAKQPAVPLRINFTPEISREMWQQTFAGWKKNHGIKKVQTLLAEIFPRKLAAALLNDPDVTAARWKSADAETLLNNITDHPFTITATDSWDRAMVTAGGVALKHIDPDSLESRLTSGLFFAGEILDLTGPCGGYNITWALASGMLAGANASRR